MPHSLDKLPEDSDEVTTSSCPVRGFRSWGKEPSAADACTNETGHAVSRVQRGRHLEDQSSDWFGHSHLNHRGPDLFVGQLRVFEIRLADGLADNRGNLGVSDVALAEQFLSLLSAEG